MKRLHLSVTAWWILVGALACLACALNINEIVHSARPLAAGERGSLGYSSQWSDASRRNIQVITALAGQSPLLVLGARVGDIVVLDRYEDDFRSPLVGQEVGLTLLRDGAATHAVVRAIALPITATYTFTYVAGLVERLLAVMFAMLIAFKQPTSQAYRALALYFVLSGFNITPAFTPPGFGKAFADLAYWITFIPFTYYLTRFAILYPNDAPVRLRRQMARALPLLATLMFIANCYVLWWATGHWAPMQYTLVMPLLLVTTCIVLIALWDGWRTSEGADRQRHLWLLFALGTNSCFELLTGLPINLAIDGVRVTTVLSHLSTVLMYVGIAYAVLKHRVFNFGFVANRALFFSVSSLTLLVSFGIIEWLSEHFLHFEGRKANVLLDGGIALGVYLVFHQIRHTFEHGLERLFFRKWHENEARLLTFTKKAPHITTSSALTDAYLAELRRFSGGAKAWLYQKGPDGDYVSAAGSHGLMPAIGVDDDLAVTLRAELTPTVVSEATPRHVHELALPMAYRGELYGFVLLDKKPNGEEYRPDEVAALGLATNHVGFDLHALRIDSLTLALSQQQRHAELDNVRIREQQATIARFQAAMGPTA